MSISLLLLIAMWAESSQKASCSGSNRLKGPRIVVDKLYSPSIWKVPCLFRNCSESLAGICSNPHVQRLQHGDCQTLSCSRWHHGLYILQHTQRPTNSMNYTQNLHGCEVCIEPACNTSKAYQLWNDAPRSWHWSSCVSDSSIRDRFLHGARPRRL